MLRISEIRCENTKELAGTDESCPRFSWIIEADGKDVVQKAFRLQVAKERDFSSPLMDSGRSESDRSVLVDYDGPALEPSTRYFYRVLIEDNRGEESPWSEPGWFETGLLSPENWTAPFISPEKERNRRRSYGWFMEKELVLDKQVAEARIYATALGLYELTVNGKPAGENVLAPGWTNYDKRLLYQTYDVSTLLSAGTNRICGHIGAGWLKGELMGGRNFFGRRNAFAAQLLVRFADGEERLITTDESWSSRRSPVLYSEIYHGETYDARREEPAASGPFSRCGVDLLPVDRSIITAQDGSLIRRQERLRAAEIIRTPRGETVLDFGQNLTGWVHFNVRGRAGDTVRLKHAEVLDRRGNFYTKNLRRAKQEITYILKGEGEESYEPRFTFQGFRYVRIVSWPGEVRAEDFEAVVVHSELEKRSSFRCSSELVNQLYRNIEWGMKGNFLDVPTDCPQRNERLGWTGDAQAFVGTANYLKYSDAFFRKWLRDLKSEQHDGGGIPHVIPDVLSRKGRGRLKDPFNPFHSSAGWSDAAAICPWEIYRSYGDLRILEEQFETMEKWIAWIRSHADDGLIWRKGWQYGDWLALDRKSEKSCFGATPNDFTATAFYANTVDIAAGTAALLGIKEKAEGFRDLHGRIVGAFRERFFTPDGHLTAPTQTAHVLALEFNLAPEETRSGIAEDLVGLIEETGHLTTGFLGTPYLNRVLARYGRNDVAAKLLLREEYPSWLYPVKQGATTIWERWDGQKPDGTFQSTGMNSFNHYAYGAVGQYLYDSVAGISPLEPGYRRILIKPHPGEGLTSAEAELKSPYGKIVSSWNLDGTTFTMKVTLPPNTSALVFLPLGRGRYQDEKGVEVGSGSYEWSYEMGDDKSVDNTKNRATMY